ncbi:unnamed protein product [Thlaspi arvense]|uniref:CCT domain-containing protein n=1 Tax=Thlaspi arvense TaxID=13288 RepID=A0AAU9REB5_THLAR|nr:unnamed protein product [Thlaspi arvense]
MPRRSGGRKKKKRGKDKTYMDTQRLPKKEEQEEEEADHQPSSTNAFSQDQYNHSMDDFDRIFDITIDSSNCSHGLTWDFWEEEYIEEDVEEEEKRLSTDNEGSSSGFWDNRSTDYEDKELGLKLNLNHQERNTRREASVLRYKEKRQSRLFSKKIRYQVRKLNADKRPRFKGRFVKRET